VNTKSQSSIGWTNWAVGAAIGALAMYFSDPDRGRRRRALVRDQVQHWARETSGALDVASRDFGNRLRGVRARARNLISRNKSVPDEILAERVRAHLGRVSSHPRAIKVSAQQGWINLSGAILGDEKAEVLHAVKGTPGVVGVSDNLQSYETAEHIPSLQGNHQPQRLRSAFGPDSWSPSTRAFAAVGGCALGCYGLLRRTPGKVPLATLGFGLMAAGILTNPRVPRRRRAAGMLGTQEPEQSVQESRPEETGVQHQPQTSPSQPGSLLH